MVHQSPASLSAQERSARLSQGRRRRSNFPETLRQTDCARNGDLESGGEIRPPTEKRRREAFAPNSQVQRQMGLAPGDRQGSHM